MFSDTTTFMLPWAVVIGASAVAAAIDLRTRRIPNLLTGPMVLGGLVWGALSGGVTGLGGAAAGMILIAAPFVVLWLLRGSGAGDAKLMAGVGAWLGIGGGGLLALACVAVTGGVLSLAYAATRGRLTSTLLSTGLLAAQIASRGRAPAGALSATTPPPQTGLQERALKLPYGVAIALGTCAAAAIEVLRA